MHVFLAPVDVEVGFAASDHYQIDQITGQMEKGRSMCTCLRTKQTIKPCCLSLQSPTGVLIMVFPLEEGLSILRAVHGLPLLKGSD